MGFNLPVFFLSLFFLSISSSSAFNITRILDQYPDFSTFNDYLTQTNLSAVINTRMTITILVVDNDGMKVASGLSTKQIRDILSVHVVLDYYDLAKLHNLHDKSTMVATLFQTLGSANGLMGFLNVTRHDGEVVLESTIVGSTVNATAMKVIVARPYNISVLQVSGVIVPKGMDNITITPMAPPPADAEAETPEISPAESPAMADVPTADAPEADVPTADAPEADSPASDPPVADGPTEQSPATSAAADGPDSADDNSPADHVTYGGSLLAVVGIMTLYCCL